MEHEDLRSDEFVTVKLQPEEDYKAAVQGIGIMRLFSVSITNKFKGHCHGSFCCI